MKTQKPKTKKLINSSLTSRPTNSSLVVTAPRKPHLYIVFALTVLFATTVIWAVLSARIHHSNADQLVNTYMFESARTFHTSTFPSAHSFLLKWPLFLIIQFAGASSFSFTLFTVLLCLLTVGGMTAVLYRIESRPAVFGTLCLGLASVLLLIPAEPYAGGILPVNMAMLATRNIEYVVYIAGLYLLVRANRFKNWYFLAGVASLTLLGASDKLFLTISLGGALIGAVTATIMRRWTLLRVAIRWLFASLIATILAMSILWFINWVGLTHISKLSGGPYGYIHSFKQATLGLVFGTLGVFTNFGANPAFDALIIKKLPLLAKTRLASPVGPAYVTNAVIFGLGAYATVRVFIKASYRPKIHKTKLDNPLKLSAIMIFSSIAAAGAFIVSDHYYVVDARYLAVVLFAVFISAATYLRTTTVKSTRTTTVLAFILSVSIISGLYSTVQTYQNQKAAIADIENRNSLVVQSVLYHPVDVLVGDYWRVLPIKDAQPKTISALPLENCTTPRNVLTSASWQKDLQKHSFAYLLSFDKSLTNFSHCSLQEVIAAYGRPNSSVLISGSLDKPQEFLLFYDQGTHKNQNTSLNTQTVLPVEPAQLVNATCDNRPVILSIVAHQDDDLLFLSPDLIGDVKAGHCIRTVYLTAGDAGSDKLYWQSRERGSEAAYSTMLKSSAVWVQKTVKLSDGQYATVANPKGNSDISLLFLRLPDGSPQGEGFNASKHESLERLLHGRINKIVSVDGQSSYTSDALVQALVAIMQIYQPTEIHAQSPVNASLSYPDHSDHLAVGQYAKSAHQKFDTSETIPVKYYTGYPIKTMPVNLGLEDINLKMMAFFAYAQFDGSVCHNDHECGSSSSYGAYLRRQYKTQP